MPGVDGVEATRQITRELPQIPVVVLTSLSDRARIVDALDSGAVGYLLASRQGSADGAALSPREAEVLRLVASGYANKAIALRLGISEKTVKNHLSAVFQKIDVTDRTQAALWAQRHEGEIGGR